MSVVINQACIFLKSFVAAASCSFLQGNDCFRTVQMVFCVGTSAQFVRAYGIQVCVYCKPLWIPCLTVMENNIFFNFFEADSSYAADCICEILVNNFF